MFNCIIFLFEFKFLLKIYSENILKIIVISNFYTYFTQLFVYVLIKCQGLIKSISFSSGDLPSAAVEPMTLNNCPLYSTISQRLRLHGHRHSYYNLQFKCFFRFILNYFIMMQQLYRLCN